jgi:hypothetical protein
LEAVILSLSGQVIVDAGNEEIVRKYLPSRYKKYKLTTNVAELCLVASILGVFITVILILGPGTTWDTYLHGEHLIYCILSLIIFLFLTVITTRFYVKKNSILLEAKAIKDLTEAEVTRLTKEANAISVRSLVELAEFVKQHTERLETMARETGDIIITGNVTAEKDATLIVGSNLVNSINKNPDSADALKTLAGFVHEAGNNEVKLVLNELLKRQAAAEDKVVTGALWERLLKLLPSLETIPDVVIKLSKLFLL